MASVIAGNDPLAIAAHNLNFTRIYVAGQGRLRISDNGSGDIETLFLSGALSDAEIHIQTAAGSIAVTFDSADIATTPSNEARLLLDTTTDELAVLEGIADGQRWLFSVTQPTPPAGNDVAVSGGTRHGIRGRWSPVR